MDISSRILASIAVGIAAGLAIGLLVTVIEGDKIYNGVQPEDAPGADAAAQEDWSDLNDSLGG